MFKIETNIGELVQNQLQVFDDLIDADKILREAALDTLALISNRVQNRGEKADGTKIVSKSPSRKGAYSRNYGLKRQRSGREVDIIDLTATDQGGMMDSLTVEPEGNNSYVVGFAGQRASDLAEYNELRFGTIFEPSDSESDLIEEVINNRIDEIFR